MITFVNRQMQLDIEIYEQYVIAEMHLTFPKHVSP